MNHQEDVKDHVIELDEELKDLISEASSVVPIRLHKRVFTKLEVSEMRTMYALFFRSATTDYERRIIQKAFVEVIVEMKHFEGKYGRSKVVKLLYGETTTYPEVQEDYPRWKDKVPGWSVKIKSKIRYLIEQAKKP
ncbi:hypothetical protein LCGC14_0616670 [marine sediment metagenome]|uniref:Uncharacterized protein n=1 Tax=marine sediment metagenome TaxID=412755 RepID=A0A0F9R613_9ZZZZ